MKEQEFENIIAKYPELIEEGLALAKDMVLMTRLSGMNYRIFLSIK